MDEEEVPHLIFYEIVVEFYFPETTSNSYKTHFIKSFDKQASVRREVVKSWRAGCYTSPVKAPAPSLVQKGESVSWGPWRRTTGQPLTAESQAPTALTHTAALPNSTVISGPIKYLLNPASLISLHSIVLGIPRTYSCNRFVQEFFSLQDLIWNITPLRKVKKYHNQVRTRMNMLILECLWIL